MKYKKTPLYIRCNKRMWNTIKPYLVEWKYDISEVSSGVKWITKPLLMIDDKGILTNVPIGGSYHSELVYNIHEFLSRAAELKGFTYVIPMNDEVEVETGKVVKLKPGMIIEGLNYDDDEDKVIVFPMSSSLAFTSVGVYSHWDTDVNSILKEITCIRDVTPSFSDTLGGEIIWEKKEIIELTMDEILKEVADKRGVSVEQIKIK